MRLGLSSASFYGRLETEEAAAILGGYGLDTCEVFLESPSEYSAAFAAQVRENLKGLPVTSVHPKGTQFEPDLFGQSKRQHRDAMDIFERVCTAGETLGAVYYVFHSVSVVRAKRSPGQLYHMTEVLSEMQSVARAHHMEVLWENVSWAAMQIPEDVREVRRLLPDQGFVLDLKQAHQVGATAQDMLDAMGENLRHLHMLDWDENNRLVFPGEGVTDFAALFKTLRERGYRGAAILEPYADQTREDARLRKSLAYLRQAMSEAGV